MQIFSEPDGPADAPADFRPLHLVVAPDGPVLAVDRQGAVLGRHSTAGVRVPEPDVSRRHCRLAFVDGGWQVVDLHSLNGVFVNGERVEHAELRHGDELRLGGFVCRIDLHGGGPAAGGGGRVIRSIVDALPDSSRRRAG